MSGWAIVEANENELPVIETVARKTWPQTYGNILTATQLEYMLERFYNQQTLLQRIVEGSLLHIFQENGQVLGFSEIRLDEKPGYTKLHKLYVLPEAQGKSVGRHLLNHVFDVTRAASQKGVFLNVNRHNEAKMFYEHLGFEVVGEEDIDIGQGFYMNDYVMQVNFE